MAHNAHTAHVVFGNKITMSPSKIWSIIWWRGNCVPSISSWNTNSSRGSISPRLALRSHSSRRLCASMSSDMISDSGWVVASYKSNATIYFSFVCALCVCVYACVGVCVCMRVRVCLLFFVFLMFINDNGKNIKKTKFRVRNCTNAIEKNQNAKWDHRNEKDTIHSPHPYDEVWTRKKLDLIRFKMCNWLDDKRYS